jgi:tRNA nucleotidyltransferase (CCA-adding enzyme)
MNIKIPLGAQAIIQKLNSNNFDAHAVGGCVRDSLLNLTPLDWDITTPATPSQIAQIFQGSKQIPIGARHGTISVKSHDQYFEITTYRIDGQYEDGRRPSTVRFTDSLKADLQRRDFTINAMAYNPSTGLVDHFGGLKDLKSQLIRCVGDAHERFSEDYLRIIRAYRFAAALNFTLEESTRSAAKALQSNLTKISTERIQFELSRLLTSPNIQAIRAFLDDCAPTLLPELSRLSQTEQNNAFHNANVYEHSLEVLRFSKPTLPQRLAALLHDTGKYITITTDSSGINHFRGHQKASVEIAKEVLSRLRFDNHTIAQTLQIIEYHDHPITPEKMALKRLISKLGIETLKEILDFQIYDNLAKTDLAIDRIEIAKAAMVITDEILSAKEPIAIKDLAISGKDIIKFLNISPGPQVGRYLKALLEAVIQDPSLNNPTTLKQLLEQRENT